MTRVALLSSEPLRERMAGIAIRYREMARQLSAVGIETVLVFPRTEDGSSPPADVEIRPFEPGRLSALLDDCDAAVAQGQLANDLLLEVPSLPTAIDLYDPWLVENLHYVDRLGLDPWRNDHATWILQFSRGDFFLCSSEEQRRYYLGFLTAVGRVNPRRFSADPELRTLIDVVPFGVPEELPPHRPYLEDLGSRRGVLFGGLYDWYDPVTALEAHSGLEGDSQLLFIRTPDPATPSSRLEELERRLGRSRSDRERTRILDWVPFERRWDLLRDVALLVSTHRPSLETDLSLRTRFLEALAAGCPVVVTEGGALGHLLREHQAGWLVPPADVEALREVLATVLAGGGEVERRRQNGLRVAEQFRWTQVLEPLERFLQQPAIDDTKEAFASPIPTRAPADSWLFRARRRWRRLVTGEGR